jgi:hypothetical protein
MKYPSEHAAHAVPLLAVVHPALHAHVEVELDDNVVFMKIEDEAADADVEAEHNPLAQLQPVKAY